jgi:hypothetical protein
MHHESFQKAAVARILMEITRDSVANDATKRNVNGRWSELVRADLFALSDEAFLRLREVLPRAYAVNFSLALRNTIEVLPT